MINKQNSNVIKYIDEGTYKALEELQTKILNRLSVEDKNNLRNGLAISEFGNDVLRREKAVRINSNSISILGARLANLNNLELKNRIISFLEKGPEEYRYLINDIYKNNLNSFIDLDSCFKGKFNEKYLNLLNEFNLEIQTLTNQIGAKLEVLNEEFSANNINKKFRVSKKIENGKFNYDCSEISQIVMNHIDSNVENVVNIYLQIQGELSRNKGLEKDENKKDILNVNNKEYQKEISSVIDAFKDIDTANRKLQVAIVYGKPNQEQFREQLFDLYDNLRNKVLQMSPIVRNEFVKEWEVVRGEMALEKSLNEPEKKIEKMELDF